MMKKRAMTLAEVLVALALIGVVAAVTLPNLMLNAQLTELESQFKKTFNELNQFAGYFQSETGMSVPFYTVHQGSSKKLAEQYATYIAKTTKVSNWVSGSTEDNPYQYHSLIDTMGAGLTGNLCDNTGYYTDGGGRVVAFDDPPLRGFNGPRVCVDINGAKKPNTWGIDVFSFLFTTDGSVIPEGMPHKHSNVTSTVYDREKEEGYAWKAGTILGEEYCYNNNYGQTCANYAALDVNPKNSRQSYWKDFIGKKQYLVPVADD